MKHLLCLALAASLSACATTSVGGSATYDQVPARITVAETTYLRIRALVDPMLPYLPAAMAERIRFAENFADRALLAARLARTLIEQKQALDDLKAATGSLTAETGIR